MEHRYDLIIVGMGSAGMVAAEFAATLGLKVAAVERDRLGGDCLWTGCVPSKALLASAKAAHTMRHADRYGLQPAEPAVDTARVLARVRAIQQDLAAGDDSPERFAGLGVELFNGAARLTSPASVQVEGGPELHARHILLCTGSRPVVPPIEGLAEAGFQTSETLWELERAPRSFVALGGGPISVELSQAFVRLGVPVTVLQREPRILPRDEPELVDTLVARLRDEGLELVLGATAQRVTVENGMKVVHGVVGGEQRSWRAEELLLGAGRLPNVEGLRLEDCGIEVGPQGVVVDRRERTAVRSVYAVGDVTGGYLFTHAAGFDAARAVRTMFFPGSAGDDDLVPWCTFTDPELAHAGLTIAEARERHGDDVEVWRRGLEHSDRARADSAGEGAIVIVTAKGRVVGAHALAPAAGELIHELALAIQQGMRLKDLASLVHVYPTLSTTIQQIAGEASFENAQRYRWLVRSSA